MKAKNLPKNAFNTQSNVLVVICSFIIAVLLSGCSITGALIAVSYTHLFENLDFTRKGSKVQDELISHPTIIKCNEAWTLWHLPTHPDHLYDVHRICLKSHIHLTTEDKCHVLSLVEGKSIRLKTQNGTEMVFHYAETFVIPAAAGSYTIINEGDSEVMIIKAFVK